MSTRTDIENDPIRRVLNDSTMVTKIIQAGIKEALLKHKKLGNSVCEWRDGKVVTIPPEEIPVSDEEVRQLIDELFVTDANGVRRLK
jgi:hypothetical protein